MRNRLYFENSKLALSVEKEIHLYAQNLGFKDWFEWHNSFGKNKYNAEAYVYLLQKTNEKRQNNSEVTYD